MTLVEVTIGVGILAMVTAGALRLAESTTKAIGTGTAVAGLDNRAQDALEDLGDILRTTSRANLTPALPAAPPFTVETRSVTLSRVTGIDDATQGPQWGPPETISYEPHPLDPPDGQDNDGNGLIDDGRIVRVEDPGGVNRRSILASGVARSLEGEIPGNSVDDNGNGLVDEAGLSFEVREGGVTVRVTLERQEPGGQVVRLTAERSFAFRNSGS